MTKRLFQQAFPQHHILQEDQYYDKLQKIIKRDYFPNLMKYKEENSEQLPEMTLNTFVQTFRSDQNDAFTKICLKQDEKWFAKNKWMFQIQQRQINNQLSIVNQQKNKQNQYMIEGSKQNQLMICPYNAQTSIYFPPQSLQSKQVGHNKKQICYQNTRMEKSDQVFKIAIEKKKQLESEINDSRILQTPQLLGIFDYESQDNRFKKPMAKQGYSLLSMPSPAPGNLFQLDKQPIMTWGQLQSTPQRMQERAYKVPNTPSRDLLRDNQILKLIRNKKQRKQKNQRTLASIISKFTPSKSLTQSFLKKKSERSYVDMKSSFRVDSERQSSLYGGKSLKNIRKGGLPQDLLNI